MRIVPHFVAVSSVNFKIYQMVSAELESTVMIFHTIHLDSPCGCFLLPQKQP
jgi:hypothetical protein